MRILLAGVGNLLRTDDGFGVEVAHRLEKMELPGGVHVVETGIGGIALVQELMEGWDALVMIDTVDYGREPGTVMLIEPEVVDVEELSWGERYDQLSDIHLAKPERVLVLARALKVLPRHVLMVGCQPTDAYALGLGLTPPVEAAIEIAISEILRHVDELMALDAAS